jgi:hypothetical protein
MPCCPAALAVVHSASVVEDLGVAGAVSIAAAAALGIGYERGLLTLRSPATAASDADADET